MTDGFSLVVFGDGFASPERGGADISPAALGNKGAGLVRMADRGLPVPPGFVLPRAAFAAFETQGWTSALAAAVEAGTTAIEQATGLRLGDPEAPLLVSVRSGAPVSMPGVMDTVCNVGMTTRVAHAGAHGGTSFAVDTYRRFLVDYATVVGGATTSVVTAAIARSGASDPDAVRARVGAVGVEVPDDPVRQITDTVIAVLGSWDSARARRFREIEGIDAGLGTAVVVQAMVFGNRNDRSGTGVAFSRSPSTGVPGLCGEFLPQRQGVDLVSGSHTPSALSAMRDRWPEIHDRLAGYAETIERDWADMVEIEFTVDDGRLWLLQARAASRSSMAAARAAVDMANDDEFPLDRTGAVARCAGLVPASAAPTASRAAPAGDMVARGLAASAGRATGALCVDPDDAEARSERGESVILVRPETSLADMRGMAAAAGLVTIVGGITSHAAVVARDWGIPAVVGASGVSIHESGIRCGDVVVAVGAMVTVDGTAGAVLLGEHPEDPLDSDEIAVIRAWAHELGLA